MTSPKKYVCLFALVAFLSTASAFATPIDDKYTSLGGANGFLGAASGAEKTSADGIGKFRHYAGGSIYFHPATGAHEVHGLIRQKYVELGSETGMLGYPMTDEIDLADGSGKVSKFQLGEVLWRSGSQTVTVVKSTDLVVDLPFPVGQAWHIVQANADANGGSHSGPWAYCWDLIAAGLDGNTGSEGKPFVAAAGAKLVFAQQDLDGPNNAGNVVIQRFGEGRYGSYLHIKKGSFTKMFPSVLPQTVPWELRSAPGSGRFLGEVGNTGTGGSHMHFCVTTTPDRGAFAPFESVPVAFRNYSFSTNAGKTWTFVPVGVPKDEQWVRREPFKPGQMSEAKVNTAVTVISHGTVKGNVALTPGQGGPTGAGTLTVRLETAWGELLGKTTINVSAAALGGPWPFQFDKVPAFNGHKLSASYSGPWSLPMTKVTAESPAFNLAPNGTATQKLSLKKVP